MPAHTKSEQAKNRKRIQVTDMTKKKKKKKKQTEMDKAMKGLNK